MAADKSNMEFFRQVFGGSWITQGISVAAELGIADLLLDGPKDVETLAERTHAHGPSLYRLLRALASVGLFSEDGKGRFSLTPTGELMRTDIPGSQRSFSVMMGAEFYQTWGELLHSVKTGEPGFEKRFGAPFFQYMTAHPERHRIYDEAMTGIHGSETQPMLEAYDFSEFKTVADIGGGNGLLLAGVLNRFPEMHGILFELPQVADHARSVVCDLGLAERCRVEGGDFFQSVPEGADAYIMRHIIHDWEDEQAIAILRNCREAMGPEAVLLVVENLIPGGNKPCFGKWLDLMMLLVGGRERTEQEYDRLFTAAGLTLKRIVPTASEVSIIEAVRASERPVVTSKGDTGAEAATAASAETSVTDN